MEKRKIVLIMNALYNVAFSIVTALPFLEMIRVGISETNVHLAAIQNAQQKVLRALTTAAMSLNPV